jgi:peptidoglycan/LPS O-acetylase OafA/YrhL
MPDKKKSGVRRHELDWLRVYAIFLLISVHAAAIFDPFPVTAVKGQETLAMKLFAIFVHTWRLSVLFVISGAGAYFALGFLSSRQFVAMRLKRIVIPLIVGTLVVVPVHLYWWVNSSVYPGRYSSYLDFYWHILNHALHGRIFTMPDYIHWAHLWFLAYLFIISLITAPLLVFLRSRTNSMRMTKLSALCETKTGILLLPAIPLVITELILRPIWVGDHGPNLIQDWANFFMYLIYYLYGYFIYSNERLRASVQRVSTIALILAIVITVVFFLMHYVISSEVSLGWLTYLALRSLSAWCWILAILGFGIKYLNYTNRLLPHANEAAYPIYIIHLPILSITAYYVVSWNVPVLVQFIVIIVGALAGSIAIYALVIKQTRITRFLFGLKPKRLATKGHKMHKALENRL